MGTAREAATTPTDDVAAVLREPDVLTAVVDASDVQDELVPQDADGWRSRGGGTPTRLLHAALLAETRTDAIDRLMDDGH